jgi:hypothetical protein
VRVLMTLDMASVNPGAEGVNRRDGDFALAWTRLFGEGRVFYTALGHFDETWLDARFQRMLEGAMLWLAREEDGAGAARRAAPRVRAVSNLARESDHAVAPGMLAAVTGVNLTPGSTMHAGFPLPTKLAGAEVLVSGRPAPVISASPERLVALVPEPAGDSLAVRVGPDASAAVALRVETAVPGILGVSRQGRVISIWATGLAREGTPEVFVSGSPAEVQFHGPAPGLAGVRQVNALLPAPVAGTYDVRIVSAGVDSNTVGGPE